MTLRPHEIATLFPSMSEVDLDHLRESIRKEGQLEDILVFEGQILDGRHRYEACVELGIEPRLREFDGDAQAAFSYSVALNLSRRHLTTVQRAAAGAGIKEFQARLMGAPEPEPQPEPAVEQEQEAEGEHEHEREHEHGQGEAPRKRKQPSPRTINAKARELASKRVGVSGRAIDEAAKIKDAAPDVFERMLAGTAGSMPDAKKVTALPREQRQRVHALVDEGTKLKAAIEQVAPPPPPPPGPVFLGKVLLEPAQALRFQELVEQRGIKRADAAKEALLDWIAKHAEAEAPAEELVGAS